MEARRRPLERHAGQKRNVAVGERETCDERMPDGTFVRPRGGLRVAERLREPTFARPASAGLQRPPVCFGAAFASMADVTRGRTLLHAVGLAVLTLAPAGAGAMTLDEAIAAGAQRGPPVVESVRTHAAAKDFARDPGSFLPRPLEITVLAGARRPYNLPLGPEIAVTATQDISGRRLGTVRRRAADWSARASASNVDRARVEGALTAGLAFIDLLEAQQLVSARLTAATDAERVARLAEVRVTSGVGTATERSLASAEVGSARLAVLDAEGRAIEAGYALALAVGVSLDQKLQAEGSLDRATGAGADAPRVLDAARRHPIVAAAEARASHVLAEVDVARAINGPFFAVGVTMWREGSGDHAAAAIATVPLPFFDPARHETARLNVFATAVSAEAQRLRGEIEREARVALHEQQHTREVRTQLRDGVVAPLRRALDTAIVSYTAGVTDIGVVILARRSALSAEERLVSAMADIERADLRVAAFAGTLVPVGGRR